MMPLLILRTWDPGGRDRIERNFAIRGMTFMMIFNVPERR